MAPRLELQELLLTLAPHVYFQPPPTVKMEYPCIIYKRDHIDIRHADNAPYKNKTRYMVTVVDRDPDSQIPYLVAALPTCLFSRNFVVDNLNHDIFNLFF